MGPRRNPKTQVFAALWIHGQRTGVVLAVGNCLVRISKIVWRSGRAGFGFVWLEFEVAGCYTETDEVFVGELDVISVLGRQRFRDELCFFGCGKQSDRD